MLEVAHLMLEEKNGVRFIFTGSSARKLLCGVNLLGGRAVLKSLHPFMAGGVARENLVRCGTASEAFLQVKITIYT